VHNKGSNKESFTIVEKLEILDSEKSNSNRLSSIVNTICQAIYKGNRLSKIVQLFIIATKDFLEQEEDVCDIGKDKSSKFYKYVQRNIQSFYTKGKRLFAANTTN